MRSSDENHLFVDEYNILTRIPINEHRPPYRGEQNHHLPNGSLATEHGNLAFRLCNVIISWGLTSCLSTRGKVSLRNSFFKTSQQ